MRGIFIFTIFVDNYKINSMEEDYKISHEKDTNLDLKTPIFIIVYNFHSFNEIDLVVTNNKNYARVSQTVGCWIVKYKHKL